MWGFFEIILFMHNQEKTANRTVAEINRVAVAATFGAIAATIALPRQAMGFVEDTLRVLGLIS